MNRLSSAPLVAIVTPVYNGEKFLTETLECVQSLDYPNLVHVVHDNCSADRTPEIIEQFKGRRVPIVTRRLSAVVPMARNWNEAVRLVPEEAGYFWLLCADDLLTPDSIRKVVDVAESDRRISVVGCHWNGEGLCGTELPREVSVFDGHDMIRRYLRRETMVLSGMNVLFRVSSPLKDTWFYDESITSFDSDVNLRLLMNGRYGFVHEELLIWRKHADSTWSTTSTKHLDYVADWLILLDRYGTYVLGHREYLKYRKAYRNYLLRRLLLRRWKLGQKDEYRLYMNELKAHDDEPGLLDFADALLDWGKYAVAGRRDRIGIPLQVSDGPVTGGGLAIRQPRI
jgi:glycosyltransferase involved in cell wall biosynthesis